MSEKYPSTEYPSTDTYIMAEAARRFHLLFGHFPDYIGVNPGNKEALTRPFIQFPMLKTYLETLMAEKPSALYDFTPAPSITMQKIAIKPLSGLGFNDFVMWSHKALEVKPEHVFNITGETVVKMLEAMGYHCRHFSNHYNHDCFSLREGDLYLNLSLSHNEYKYPEMLSTVLMEMVASKFKQAKQAKQPQNKTVAEMDVKINVDASELMKHLKTPERANCKTYDHALSKNEISNHYEETCNTMAKPAKQTAKVIFPLNGEMYELELIAYDFTQTVDIASGLTCHFEGDSLREPKPLKKEASAGRLTLEDGATYELYPVTEL
jgi:hypothetical protein